MPNAGFRILVIEDDQGIRELLVEVLVQEGYQAACAENGERALERLAAGEQADVLLLDLMMPVMDGLTFLARLRAHPHPRLAALPVIVATAGGPLLEARAIGAVAVLSKPVDLALLLRTVERACESAG